MEDAHDDALNGEPVADGVFGLTEYEGAPPAAPPPQSSAGAKPPTVPVKVRRPKKAPPAPSPSDPEVVALNQAMVAEQEARDRLQKLKAMAQRHIVSAAARSAVAAQRVHKRQQAIEARRDRDQRMGRTLTHDLGEIPKASDDEVKHMSVLFNQRCDLRTRPRPPLHAQGCAPYHHICAARPPRLLIS